MLDWKATATIDHNTTYRAQSEKPEGYGPSYWRVTPRMVMDQIVWTVDSSSRVLIGSLNTDLDFDTPDEAMAYCQAREDGTADDGVEEELRSLGMARAMAGMMV